MPPDHVSGLRQRGYYVPDGPQFEKGIAWTSYFSHATEVADQQESFTPIGALVASLSQKTCVGGPVVA